MRNKKSTDEIEKFKKHNYKAKDTSLAITGYKIR